MEDDYFIVVVDGVVIDDEDLIGLHRGINDNAYKLLFESNPSDLADFTLFSEFSEPFCDWLNCKVKEFDFDGFKNDLEGRRRNDSMVTVKRRVKDE